MIKHNHENCKKYAHVLMYLSYIALALAAIVSLFQIDLWLAGTQWILVSIILAIYALIFGGGCNSSCGSDEPE